MMVMTGTTNLKISHDADAGHMQEESFMKHYLQMKKSEKHPEPMKVSKESTRYLLLKENMHPLVLKKGTQNGRNIPERFLTIFTYGLTQ